MQGASRLSDRPRVLVDTDVWVDFLTDRHATAKDIARVFEQVEERGGTLLTAVSSLQEIFAGVSSFLDQELAQAGEQTSLSSRREVAWGCVRMVRERSAIVSAGLGDCLEAEALRPLCDDYAQALAIVAARRGEADVLLCEDGQLKACAPCRACTLGELASCMGINEKESTEA